MIDRWERILINFILLIILKFFPKSLDTIFFIQPLLKILYLEKNFVPILFPKSWKRVLKRRENFYFSQPCTSLLSIILKFFPQSSWKRVKGNNIIVITFLNFSLKLLIRYFLSNSWRFFILKRISCQSFSLKVIERGCWREERIFTF